MKVFFLKNITCLQDRNGAEENYTGKIATYEIHMIIFMELSSKSAIHVKNVM